MKMLKVAVLAVVMACSSAAAPITLYDNTANDTLVTYLYSAGGFTAIGDAISLAGTERTLNSASVQFFNLGSAGTFSASLTFHDAGSPVGSQIGSSYIIDGISMDALDIRTVTFSNLGLPVPGDGLVFMVAVSNILGDMDLGLNAFAPPSIGSSNSESIIVNDGLGFLEAATSAGEGNLYFRLDATAIPEPSTLAAAGSALLLGLACMRRRRMRAAKASTSDQ